MDLLEAIPEKVLNKREVEVIILEEGPGNRTRKCWYGKEAIESGPPVFRGAQVYANHPSKTQMSDLPERDVRELVARVKECWVAKSPSTGKLQLRGIMKVLEGSQYDWVLSLMHESIKAQREGFPPVAQVSIHADGDVEKRMIESEEYNYVKNIKSAVSVDVVTKGGIKGAGFTKFVESSNGGKTQMTKEERLAMIQKKMQDAINAEDAAFLESLEQEEANLCEDDGDEGEYEQVFATEDGFVTAEGDPVEDGEVFAVDEQENVYTPDQLNAMAENAEEVDEAELDEDSGDYDEEDNELADVAEQEVAESDSDEVPISELSTRFPHLANQIDREEATFKESDRDVDIVNLKFENKLLKSRAIAERKILESQLPAGFISVDELLGKPPEDMDRIIESKSLMVQNIVNLVESQAPANPPAQVVRESDCKPGVGRRILESSVLPQ